MTPGVSVSNSLLTSSGKPGTRWYKVNVNDTGKLSLKFKTDLIFSNRDGWDIRVFRRNNQQQVWGYRANEITTNSVEIYNNFNAGIESPVFGSGGEDYYIGVTSATQTDDKGMQMIGYTITVNFEHVDNYEVEGNDSKAEANELTNGQMKYGAIDKAQTNAYGRDWYKFTLSNPSRINVNLSVLSNPGNKDLLKLLIRDESGKEWASQSKIRTGVGFCTDYLPANTYYIVLFDDSISGRSTVSYFPGVEYGISYENREEPAPSLKSAKNSASQQAVIKWGKVSGVDGYEVMYSLKSDFSSKNKTVNAKKSASSIKVKKLKKKKTYFVRVRSYKLVGGKKAYSNWSAVKKLKIKK